MPFVLILALAGSLAIHGVALFGTNLDWMAGNSEPTPLRAELRPPPAVAPSAPPAHPAAKTPARKPRTAPLAAPQPDAGMPSGAIEEAPSVAPAPTAPTEAEPAPEVVATPPPDPPPPPPEPVKPVLAASGTIRYSIYHEGSSLLVGRGEHHWQFDADGHYRLTGTTETSGLLSLFKPVRLVMESSGQLVATGLQPTTFRSWKNGQDANENADFDWSATAVSLSRDGSVRHIAAGTQDILSLNYQFAYAGDLSEGALFGVVTGKKYERYTVESLGEEALEIPAGRFRTLHLRAAGETTTEIWIALDHYRLPVKIRFTDKKGDSFSQVATELGSP